MPQLAFLGSEPAVPAGMEGDGSALPGLQWRAGSLAGCDRIHPQHEEGDLSP